MAYLGTTSLLLMVVTWGLQRISSQMCVSNSSPFGWFKAFNKKGNRKKELKDDLREKCAGRAIYGRTPTPSWDDCSVWKYKQRNRWDEIRPSANEFSIVANFWEKGWTVCSYLMAPPTEVNVVMVVLGKVDHRSLVFGLLQPSLQLSWLWKIFWYVS